MERLNILRLFGLTAVNAANHKKDISIGKILGADIVELVYSLLKNLLWRVCLSIFIAITIGWWAMNRWLSDFAYRINITWDIFAITGILALIFAFLAMSIHSIKAALISPLEGLRIE